jgi:hypothetical protein
LLPRPDSGLLQHRYRLDFWAKADPAQSPEQVMIPNVKRYK